MIFEQKLRIAEKYLYKKDPVIAGLIDRFVPCTIKPHRDYYGELVSSVVGQQLSVKAAATIWQRVLDMFGGKMPKPQELLKVDDQKLRDAGLSWSKVSYIKDLAQHVLDGRLDLEHISTMPNEQLIEQLVAVKGIGEWSTHMFMIFSLGRLDVLPAGDLGIRKGLMQNYKLKDLPDPATCITIANKIGWHPYESVASWYIWKSLDASPHKKTRHNV